MTKSFLTLALLLVLAVAAAPPFRVSADEAQADWDIPNGHFYTQASGQPGAGKGYAITNDDGILFWTEFKRLGGVSVLGYPVSHRFVWDGFVVQATQRVVMQWRPEVGQVYFVNVFDRLHDLGKDSWLDSVRSTPAPFDSSADSGLSWDQVMARHWKLLDENDAIKKVYWADSDPLQHFGLPVAYKDYGNVFVVRAQRAVFQQWKEKVAWAEKGQVTVALGGDIAKELNVFPGAAVTPGDATGGGGVVPAPTPMLTAAPSPAPTPVPTPAPSPAFSYSYTALGWEPNCGLTQMKVFVRDTSGNAVNGVRVRIESGGGWSANSNPTGSTGYNAGWTDFLLRSGMVRNTWIVYVIDDGGNRASDNVLVTTDDVNCGPGGSGHQVGTVTFTKN